MEMIMEKDSEIYMQRMILLKI